MSFFVFPVVFPSLQNNLFTTLIVASSYERSSISTISYFYLPSPLMKGGIFPLNFGSKQALPILIMNLYWEWIVLESGMIFVNILLMTGLKYWYKYQSLFNINSLIHFFYDKSLDFHGSCLVWVKNMFLNINFWIVSRVFWLWT